MQNSQILLFPFETYWWLYAAFTLFVIFMLVLDLGVFHKEAHVVKFKEAAAWSTVWVSLALLFAVVFYYLALWRLPLDPRLTALPDFDAAALAQKSVLEFLTGFIVEKSLAIDNIFIFIVVFRYFMIPAHLQHRVLFYGIIGAFIFRAIFIALGAVLMQYHAVVILFGVFLILTGVKMILGPEKPIDPNKNPVIRFIKKFVPVTPQLEGDKFILRKDGVLYITPLFIALIFLELTDIIFAVDSVPAIFALTKEPLIVFTSNIFAILGLRAMFFMLAGFMDKFHLLKFGLAGVLIFVGLKMVWLNNLFGGKFPITWSLAIITGLIGSAVIASFIFPPKNEAAT